MQCDPTYFMKEVFLITVNHFYNIVIDRKLLFKLDL